MAVFENRNKDINYICFRMMLDKRKFEQPKVTNITSPTYSCK